MANAKKSWKEVFIENYLGTPRRLAYRLLRREAAASACRDQSAAHQYQKPERG